MSTEANWTGNCVTDGFVPSAFYGSNPALGNSGDQVILDWDTDTADSIFAAPAYAKDQTSAGYSWQLDSASVDVTLGADGTYWCESVTQITTSTDYGTPGAATDTKAGELPVGGPAGGSDGPAGPDATVGTSGLGTDPTVSRQTSRTVTHSISQARPVIQPAITSVNQCTPR